MDNEQEMTWKKTVVAQFKELSRLRLEELKEQDPQRSMV